MLNRKQKTHKSATKNKFLSAKTISDVNLQDEKNRVVHAIARLRLMKMQWNKNELS